MKIAYFGFDLFYECLEYLSSKFEIIKIFTCKVDGEYEFNKKTYSLAKKKNIPITDEKITADMITELEKQGCDILFSAGYYFKIPVSPKMRSVNIHPSLLPEGRGPWPLPWIILKNIKNTGVTAHTLSSDFDTGDILLQKKIDLNDSINLDELTLKMQDTAIVLTKELFSDFDFFWKNKKKQTGGSYWKEPTVKDMTFTVEDDFETVDSITRAFFDFRCYCNMKNETVVIKRAKCFRGKKDIPENCETVLELRDGFLCILKLS